MPGSVKCSAGCTCKKHQHPGCARGCTCGKHALRNNGQFGPANGGRTMGGGAKRGWKGTPDERFDAKVLITDSGCHLWTGAFNGEGYGSFRVDGKHVLAHIYADDRANGPIPEGLQRDHLCRITQCVNPEHIERVTPAENNRRAREAVA